MERRMISIILVIILSLIALIIVIPFQNQKSDVDIKMSLFCNDVLIEENSSQELTFSIFIDDMPARIPVTWSIETEGPTGEILPLNNNSATNDLGVLTAVYYAPEDIDELAQNVSIIAKIYIENQTYTTAKLLTIYPVLYQTTTSLSCEKKEIIAGETNILTVKLFMFDELWLPLSDKTVELDVLNGDILLFEFSCRTDARGYAKAPVFISNIEQNSTITIQATYHQNLTEKYDYDQCSANTSFKIIEEKPGDFPIVLIHGWSGSITDSLINFTWYNITKKLQKNHYTVLDFDVIKPGIQWLMYNPQWFEHHIPWIAARVCEKIKEALVLNGYSANQTIDIVAHSMGGLISRFFAEKYASDTDYWDKNWNGTGSPWYGDGDVDITLGPYQIDDIIAVGTPNHGVPPHINSSFLRQIIKNAYFPWWIGPIPDMVYNAPFLTSMGYTTSPYIDYYAVGGDIGIIFGDQPVDFNDDGIGHYSDGLVPSESPYLTDEPFFLLEGKAWPLGQEDHLSLIATNEQVHDYILLHLLT